ncbi:MAG: alpha/beta hydrolase [Gammaproteobacteria bacterium]|nr:alpha/beta hydrolase [Gammaproteobacteria bacterium]
MGPRTVLAALLGSLPLFAQAGALELEDCRIQDTEGTISAPAQCGLFQVPENPDDPLGKQIELFVARVPTLNQQRSEQAFVLLAGGPGQAASEAYASNQQAFERIRRSHDILLVDQRGTGKSNRMACDFSAETESLDWEDEGTTQALKECRDHLPGDPRYYTTSVAVRDLEAVRAALGYTQLVLYGGSYGTLVAQHYLRRYPDKTRSVILDGVVPPGATLATDVAPNAQLALDQVFARCLQDTACNASYPELAAAFGRVARRLKAEPVELDISDPMTAKPLHMTLGYDLMAAGIRLLSYRPETIALIPLTINEADKGNYGPLAAQSLLSVSSLNDMLALGMHNAVMCTEDIPFVDLETVDMLALESTYLGSDQLNGLRKICEIWPQGLADPDIKEPVISNVPVLLLSGEADPVTPPVYADRVAATLQNSRHLVGPGQGHGMISVGCVSRLVADFTRDGSLDQLDGECVQQMGPTPFFLDFNGPTP